MKSKFSFPKVFNEEMFLFVVFFALSWILMWKTFRVSPQGNLIIASKAWSDFAATIPLIRSFSMGNNFPPEYPIFAGPPIRYHFIFYAIVGILEKTGFRLDWALNSLSSVFFFFLLLAIYLFGKMVFKSRAVGIVSIILFLFNGSFGFLEFFKKYPLSLHTLTDIIGNTSFSSFGPYDGNVVSAFWNLNIYTNQRHLALAYAVSIFLMLIIYKSQKNPKKLTLNKCVLMGVLLGIFPFVHLSAFIMSGIGLFVFFLIFPNLRKRLFLIGIIALILAIPQYLYMGSAEIKSGIFHPGYLVGDLTVSNFINYWFLNLGLTILLAPIGFFLANKEQRRMLIPFLSFFVIGNLFQFTPDMPTNHKFFNLFVIGLNFYTSYFLIYFFNKVKITGKIVAPLLLIFLILSGFIDIFPIFNDSYITLEDIPNNRVAAFIQRSTPKNTTFLNAGYLYDPASMAGRKIYMGWPYFSWGAGYDTNGRDLKMKLMLSPTDTASACELYEKEGIDFIETQIPSNFLDTPVNYSFFDSNFVKIYLDPTKNFSVYEIAPTCDKLISL